MTTQNWPSTCRLRNWPNTLWWVRCQICPALRSKITCLRALQSWACWNVSQLPLMYSITSWTADSRRFKSPWTRLRKTLLVIISSMTRSTSTKLEPIISSSMWRHTRCLIWRTLLQLSPFHWNSWRRSWPSRSQVVKLKPKSTHTRRSSTRVKQTRNSKHTRRSTKQAVNS